MIFRPFKLFKNRRIAGFASGSTALANILYSQPFTYTLDANGNSTVENKGSGSNMEMASGRGIDLDPTQSFTVTANYILWYDLDDKKHYSTTTSKTFSNDKVNSILPCANEITSAHIAGDYVRIVPIPLY